jgi:hypothetical protein
MAIEILDKGACKAMGVLDTSASVVSAATAGIRRVISTGVAGRVRLVLEEGIAQSELIAHVTPLPPFIGTGVTPAVAWIDDFTVEIQTYDVAGALAAAQVRFSFYRIQALASPVVTPALPNPQQILGANLALWLQADLGLPLVPDSPVTTWPNQVANGNAVQGANPAAPTLLANAFGSRPGVAFTLATQGLVATLTTPIAIGQRPYIWIRMRWNALVTTPFEAQDLVQVSDSPLTEEIFLEGSAAGTFDPVSAFWDFTFGPPEIDTFEQLPGDFDFLPHTIQASQTTTGTLVADGVVTDAPSPIPAASVPYTKVNIARSGAGTEPGFCTLGLVVIAFDTPTPAQIAAVAAWCNAYS